MVEKPLLVEAAVTVLEVSMVLEVVGAEVMPGVYMLGLAGLMMESVGDGSVLIGSVRVSEGLGGAVLGVEVRTVPAGVMAGIPGETGIISVVRVSLGVSAIGVCVVFLEVIITAVVIIGLSG